MLFFKNIFKSRGAEKATDRRGARRYTVGSDFPVKVVFNAIGRDENGVQIRGRDGEGWDWTGRLLNLSEKGAHMQVPATVYADRGDACRIKFEVDGYSLVVRGQIAHITERRDSLLYGMALETDDPMITEAYHQLLELVALGASLEPVEGPRPDKSGYLFEQYLGEPYSRLDVWRNPQTTGVSAFDLKLRDCHIRGLADSDELEYLLVIDGKPEPAPSPQAEEIKRLYHWVLPNIPKTVAEDVRAFLGRFKQDKGVR